MAASKTLKVILRCKINGMLKQLIMYGLQETIFFLLNKEDTMFIKKGLQILRFALGYHDEDLTELV